MSTEQFTEIRRLALIAMFSDDDLMEVLVLKGGNALDIAYGQAGRASYDLDFSMAKEFRPEELASVSTKIKTALQATFHERGYEVFDVTFAERPRIISDELKDFWGGYQVEFKAIKADEHAKLAGNIEAMRRQAAVVGPRNTRKLKIDISKFECCDLKLARDVDGFTVYVYAPELFVVEKLRAICQQNA
ncbi:MAG: nucleotidyl transferase AbiEii/AbiGii toxin family protein [Planctomycetota bacterium]